MAIKNSSSSSTGFGDASARAEVSDHSVYRVLEDGHSIYDHEIWKSKHTLFNIVYIYTGPSRTQLFIYYIYAMIYHVTKLLYLIMNFLRVPYFQRKQIKANWFGGTSGKRNTA